MKSTARIHANFSLPLVFLEKIIMINGNSQIKAITAKENRENIAKSSIVFILNYLH